MPGNPKLKCRIYPFDTTPDRIFVVVCSFYKGRILLSQHKKRNTWETQGGHIEAGETPLEAARRELYEESGVKDADVYPVCDYLGYTDEGSAYGAVFLADVHAIGELPESEMKEIRIFDEMPEALTYPHVTPRLFAEAEKVWKGIQNE